MDPLHIFFLALLFILGLFVGSFLNLVADRSKSGESIVFGRSHCDFCLKPLRPKDLVPFFSYILNKGNCAHCKEKLSSMYPLSELLTGLVFASAAYHFKLYQAIVISPWALLGFSYVLVVSSFYIIMVLTDIKTRIIPNRIVYPAILFVSVSYICASVAKLISSYTALKQDPLGKYLLQVGYFNSQVFYELRYLGVILLSAVLIAAFFILLIVITKGRGMGFGDVRLGLLIGLVNGFPNNIVAIFLGFLTGALYSVAMILLGKNKLKDTIAFGPFLILGSVIAYIWGSELINWYFDLFRS